MAPPRLREPAAAENVAALGGTNLAVYLAKLPAKPSTNSMVNKLSQAWLAKKALSFWSHGGAKESVETGIGGAIHKWVDSL